LKQGAPAHRGSPCLLLATYSFASSRCINEDDIMHRPCRILRFVCVLALVAVSAGKSLQAQTAEEQASIVKLLRSGSDAMHNGNPSAAESIFQQVIAAAPSLSDGYLGLGLAQLQQGKTDEASHALTRASELNPRLPGAHMFLGIAQYHMGQVDPAAASLRAEIALSPNNTEALTWLGIVEIEAGHPERATEPLGQAAALSPEDANILYYSGKAHSLVGENFYKQLYQLDPDSALVHRALAESLAASNQPEKSIAEFEAAIRKQPDNADLYELLGEANQKVSRNDAATKAFEAALQRNPNSAVALYSLGSMKVQAGKPEEGVQLLRKAEALHSRPAPTDFYLGLGLAELGQTAEAVQWFERSLANQPSSFIQQSAYYQLARAYQKLDRKADAQRALTQLQKLKTEAAKTITQQGEPPAPNSAATPATPQL
jgi:tetratricopeptide (TPR) repeat protein